MDDDTLQISRKRIAQIFRFLQALDQHRNPPKRQVSEQPWILWLKDLPSHPSIQNNVDDFVLRVKRPILTRCAPPPDNIANWLEGGWEDPFQEIKIISSQNEPLAGGGARIVRLEDDPKRVSLLADWKKERDEWSHNEQPARQAMKIFEKLYELHGQLEREGERVELVLGDGILSWRRPEGGVYHPVLLKRLELQFHPHVPEFLLVETEHPVELYSSLFQSMQDVDAKSIAQCREELEQGGYHPTGDDATTGFLRAFVARLSPKGELCEDGAPQGETDHPRIGRSPIIFLRFRTLGFPMALEGVLEDLRSREEFPTSLLHVAGIECGTIEVRDEDERKHTSSIDHSEILFSKAANKEQEQIVERLGKSGNIVVQGPPGTGKTHTIANLIGHLLAHNKSVLVTSHTAKALRVLRDDHLVSQLQPLCVSVLGNDTKGREQLKHSVETIAHRVGSSDAQQLEGEAAQREGRRRKLIAELEQARHSLLEARQDEYRDIVIAGQAWQPSDAARKVTQGKEQNGWIPSPVTPGATLPLSPGELTDLYRTNCSVTPEDEIELSGTLPLPDQLLTPEEFDRLLKERDQLANTDLDFRAELWSQEPQTATVEELQDIERQAREAIKLLVDSEPWKLAGISAGMHDNLNGKPWELLVSTIQAVNRQATNAQVMLLRHAPVFSQEQPLQEQTELAEQILTHLNNGGRLNRWVLLTHPSWKRFIANSRVAAGSPQTVEHFRSLLLALRLQISRKELMGLWDRQMARLGALPAIQFGDEPEKVCLQFVPIIQDCLNWHGRVWKPIEERLQELGFQWKAFLQEQPPDPKQHGDLLRLKEAVSISLPPILSARANFIRSQLVEEKLADPRKTLESYGSSGVINCLRESATQGDPATYAESFRRLVDLHGRNADMKLRRELLARLEKVAPAWAASICVREGLHGKPTPSGDVAAAWIWRQMNDELDRRQKIVLEEIQRKIERLSDELREVTAELIDRRAWAAQVRRTGLSQRQALLGWLDTVRHRGFERGRRAHILQAQAARLMSQCKNAVPVWVMPLSRVVENFDLRTTRFDVVIIDEASQSDVMALLAFYMAKQVVVVGDHEQVSPTSFQELAVVQHLIDQFLQGIPNAHLYDGTTSIYDLARQSFGGSIPLLEHFRCVPEIIQFSNHLSYNGKLSPLRDASRVERKPHVIAHRVRNGRSDNKVNKEEGIEIASLIAALIEQPEYQKNERGDDITIGVISLVGEEQAREIDRLVRLAVKEEEYARRRILCGNSAQFQGDERDVVLLSVVDTAEDGPLSMRQEQIFKQRFNVAASRARDQLWVVHSLNPSTDLKPGDLRLRLIRHAEDPQALLRQLEQTERRVESELERLVARRLVERGYRITPQRRVGYYRIDLVVEGAGKNLAVECDGDRFHPLEKLKEDMERQAILERLGWKFVRIRGSYFFRKPDQAMQPIFERLETLGIPPEGPHQPTPNDSPREIALLDRIIRRAEEIRREWKGSDTTVF